MHEPGRTFRTSGTGAATRRAAARLLSACVLIVLFSQCAGKKEPPADVGRVPAVESATPGPGGPSGSLPSPQGAGVVSVRVVPAFPSRIDPPRAVVGSSAGSPPFTYTVYWFINGQEGPTGERLVPEAFARGDRIQAAVRWNAEGANKEAKSREVVAGNSPSTIGEVKVEPAAPSAGSTVRAVASVADLDGDQVKLKYRWYVDDMEVPGAAGETLSLQGIRKGSWVHVGVETQDDTRPGAWRYSAKYKVVNSPPVVRSSPSLEIPPDRKFVYPIVAEDPDGDPLAFTLVKGPPGMVLNGATLEWLIPEESLGKRADVEVRISDGNGGDTLYRLEMTVRK